MEQISSVGAIIPAGSQGPQAISALHLDYRIAMTGEVVLTYKVTAGYIKSVISQPHHSG